MIDLLWPWLLVLAPLPWLYRLLRKPAPNAAPALRAPFYAGMTGDRSRLISSYYLHWLRAGLLTIVWLGLLLASSRPTWVGEPVALPATGRDLLLAVDVSDSMKVEDMQMGGEVTNRLQAVKRVVNEFVEQRGGDRLGLILFGSNAYLQTPLTFDHRTLQTLLQEAFFGIAGSATAIGDAIGLGVKRLQSRPEASRVMILLSDGADTASEVPPLQAAELAAANGVRIHTIGIGGREIIRNSFFGSRRINPSADLDEKTLTAIADKTGGRYFRAHDPRELAEVYNEINRLEPVEQAAETLRPTKALFYWPLAVAVIASFLLALLHGRGGDE